MLEICPSKAEILEEYSTRSPLLPYLSRHTQSGRWSSFGKRVWFTESHITLVISFCLFTSFILDTKKMRAKAYIKSKANHVSFNKNGHWHSPTSLPYATAFLPRLPASVVGCQPLSHLNFSSYHSSYLSVTVSEHTLPN